MSERLPDVVIVGGGIVGASAAAFLAAAGAQVTVVEREALASGASGANSGVVQHPFDPVLAGLYRETVGHYRALDADGVGFAMGAEPSGLLYVSRDEGTVRSMDADLGATFPDLVREVLGGAALTAVEPAVADDLWACRVEIGFPVQPGASTYAYATLAERQGVRVRVGRTASVRFDGDRAVGVEVDGERVAADAVLVAAGPWTPGVIDPTGRWAPIQPRYGVVVETELPTGPRHVLEEAEIDAAIGVTAGRSPDAATSATSDDERADFSLVPLGGVASVGSTFLAREPDPQAWIEPILTRGARFVPALVDAPIRGTRSCARPQSHDGRPLIGAIPWQRGLFVCAGHGSWGISTGPASARLVADAILGRDPAIPAELAPGRFGSP